MSHMVEDVQRLVMSSAFESKPWLVHITPVPLGDPSTSGYYQWGAHCEAQ